MGTFIPPLLLESTTKALPLSSPAAYARDVFQEASYEQPTAIPGDHALWQT
jgi:hypothetical protein